MKQLLKLLRLINKDRYLLINSFILLGLVKLGLWLLPFQTLRQLLARISQPNPRLDQAPISKIIWAINVSTRYMPSGAKCLARALVCQVLMTRRGYSPELRIGVAKSQEGKLEAHAWIESQGQVVIGDLKELPRFTQLPSLPGNKI
ncbi:lasso peptide biosynthesis B2 protein [Nostoc sp. UHCC 0302]|uniref:lasso peptide biosynthesis B2 protein n=1 Tax=Nostoc sp. UHCC 0302 TaxID=3134896 RepID=UPI00311CDB2E